MFVDTVVTSVSGAEGAKKEPHFSYSGIISVKLHKVFPQIVLDSNKNDKFFMKIRSTGVDRSQKIDLEANFSEYFDLYAPKGINANTLSVLAPNFMQLLIDASSTFDVEVYGDRLYLITQDPLYTARVMNEALDALREQLAYMKHLEISWSYKPLAQPFDVLKRSDKILSTPYSFKLGPYRINIFVLIGIVFVILFLMPFIPFIITLLSL
jgi:hypothetical protein